MSNQTEQIYNNILDSEGRLTQSISPLHYDLIIKPNFETFTFEGKVIIEVVFGKMSETSKKIKQTDKFDIFGLHSKNLEISKVRVEEISNNNKSSNTLNVVADFTLDVKNEILIIKPGVHINAGTLIKLTIYYTGTINDELKGFYRSKYTTKDSESKIKEHWIATTQFESTDARQAFPCFDEPHFKSSFDVTIIHDSHLTALSNEDVLFAKTIRNMTMTKFKRTPIMSTYLVAFIVGQFGYVEGYSKSNKRVRVYTTNFANQNLSKMNYAKNVSIKCLDWFEEYFNITYPISKMDMIAIPDFGSGAMENWGLITFRPEYLLCDDTNTIKDRIHAVVTIAHEISHQWFGNYVTMEFWNYLWLNESMATYYGWLVCDELFPDWGVWDMFAEQEYMTALELDSLESSHQVEFDASIVKKPKDIDQIFDGISYSKGSCLIKGLAERLGHKLFRRGMQIYMNTHAWKNTKSSDLWKAFNEAIKENPQSVASDETGNEIDDKINLDIHTDIGKLMYSWTNQMGYPVVIFKKNDSLLVQSRYLKSGPNDDKSTWIIPISIETSECGKMNIIMRNKVEKHIFPKHCQCVINPQRHEFYRVMYDVDTISQLPFDLNNLAPKVVSRILDDAFAFGFSGYQKMSIPVLMVKELNLENVVDYNLWSTILSNFAHIYKLLDKHIIYQQKWNKFMSQMIVHHVKKLLNFIGFEDVLHESINSEYLRPLLLDFLNLINDDSLTDFCREKFYAGQYKNILKNFVANATNEEFEKIIGILDNESDHHLKKMVLESLGNVNSVKRVDYILSEVLENKIRDHDIAFLLSLLSKNKYGTVKVWEYVTKKWNKCDAFGDNSSKVTYLVKAIASGFNTEHELNTYENFFASRPNGTDMVVDQTIERIKNKISCVNRVIEFVKTC